MTTQPRKLRLILGDQLNHHHSWLGELNDAVVYVLMEVMGEQEYVRHHIQKTVSFFAAMRAFAQELRALGHEVVYIALDDPENRQTFPSNLQQLFTRLSITSWEYQQPDEYRLDQLLNEFAHSSGVPFHIADTEHFLTPRYFLAELFKGKRTYLMESFYRKMRQNTGVLMVEGEPAGGQWNYDADNRQAFQGDTMIPPYPVVHRNVSDLVAMIRKMEVPTMGEIAAQHFDWPVTRQEGLDWLAHFVQHRLALFGKYQDAMVAEDPFLFHSRLSFLMNAKLLSPLEVIQAVETAWQNDPEKYPLAAVEGFIRQILGWREFMRGVYWARMPQFATENYFGHQRPLPSWFWTGRVGMKCLRSVIGQSLHTGYAHHIQRLMVTGNFALLAGLSPDELDEWYLGIYVDAIEWVEITNTRGMSQFADGGWVATKPYVSSANYLSKMSNYCKGCKYNAKEKVGEQACPFNSLYWHFHHRHREKLGNNPRIGMTYRTWDKMAESQQQTILRQAELHLSQLENL